LAGRGPAPKPQSQRRNRARPKRGEWQPTAGIGWQFAPFPQPPDGVLEVTRAAWETWFRAWFAAHWTLDDLPGLRLVAKLYDQVERGGAGASTHGELRQMMDGYGITPKGQRDNRWQRPEPKAEPTQAGAVPAAYAHLRVVTG
jgi:hypothetical protein